MKRIHLNTSVVAIVSFLWSAEYYLNQPYLFGTMRPFAYRALVPILAHLIELVGVPSGISLVVIMTLSGVGFYIALQKLASEFTDLTCWQELGLLVGVLVSMFVLGQYRHPYDLMTAFLFTIALYYIWNVEVWKYLVVFALAGINRETAFLLIPISIMAWASLLKYKTDHLEVWSGWIAQIPIYILVTFSIRRYFAGYQGFTMLVDPLENIRQLSIHPYWLITGVVLVSIAVLWMFRKPQSAFLKMSFVVLAPTLLVMWVVCGQWDEIRVFWELAPVVILLMVL